MLNISIKSVSVCVFVRSLWREFLQICTKYFMTPLTLCKKIRQDTQLQTSCRNWWGPNLHETSHHRAARAACRSAAGGWPAPELLSGFPSLFPHALSPYWIWSKGPLWLAGPSSGLQGEAVKWKGFSRTYNMDADERCYAVPITACLYASLKRFR